MTFRYAWILYPEFPVDLSSCRYSGILIPVCDKDSQILGLQLRLDEPPPKNHYPAGWAKGHEKGERFRWLSTGGMSNGKKFYEKRDGDFQLYPCGWGSELRHAAYHGGRHEGRYRQLSVRRENSLSGLPAYRTTDIWRTLEAAEAEAHFRVRGHGLPHQSHVQRAQAKSARSVPAVRGIPTVYLACGTEGHRRLFAV